MLRAREEDWRRRGGVGAQRRGRVSLLLYRNQHQLCQILLTGPDIYNQTSEQNDSIRLDMSNCGSQLQEPDKAKVTVTLQLSLLLGPPLPDCPVSVGQHIWTNFDDAH